MKMRMFLTVTTQAVLPATAVLAADAKAGKSVYQSSCKGCHGPTGAGNPSVAKMMKVEIRDLKSPEVQTMSDADINHHGRERQDAGRQGGYRSGGGQCGRLRQKPEEMSYTW
jgi:mono/diheme cytochrome c family protein